jgi:hypothetical protein
VSNIEYIADDFKSCVQKYAVLGHSAPKSDAHHWARLYAAIGQPVFPLLPNSKFPATPNGFKDATTDQQVIDGWFAENANYNVGIATGTIGVVDLDIKNGADGIGNWNKLASHEGFAPGSPLTAKTPTGGRHLLMLNPTGLRNSASKIGQGIDFRGVGGYVAAPPSVIDGASYEWLAGGDDIELALLSLPSIPQPVIEKCTLGKRERRFAAEDAGDKADRPQAIALFQGHLKRNPIPPEGEGSDEATFKAVCRGFDLGLRDETISAIVRGITEFDEDWIEEKMNNAAAYQENQWGCDIPLTGAEAFGTFAENLKAADVPANDDGPRKNGSSEGSGKLSFADAMAQLGLDLGAANNQREPDPPRLLMHAALMERDDKEAEYLWDGWVLAHEVNLLYGDGKTGKTMLSLHLAVARAAGINLFGKAVQSGAVLIITTEDKAGPIKFAVQKICKELGVDPKSPLPIAYSCRPRIDTTLAEIKEDGSWQPGMFLRTTYEDVRELTAEYGECLVILDPLVTFATLNEILRPPAHTLCQVVLPGFCDYLGATVLVDAHPSEQQKKSGRGGSGSTGWRNATRNMLILEKDDPLDELDPARTFRSGGSNYGSPDRLHLNLNGPVFSINRDWREPRKLSAPEKAAAFLREMLYGSKTGMTKEELTYEGEGLLISWASMRRAIDDELVPVVSTRGTPTSDKWHPEYYWRWVEPEVEDASAEIPL